jgi:hypothetical protein
MGQLHGQDLLQVSETAATLDPGLTICRWPVIVAIVVGSLIILSIVLCVARCICCGAECACCCFRCCAGCCGSGRKGHKRMNSTAPPPTYPSYGAPPAPAPAPMPFNSNSNARPINEQYKPHAVPTYRGVEPERPQFATFEATSKPVNEDALPAMPSWSEATSYKVEETVVPEKKGDMEMDRLDQNGSVTSSGITAAAAVAPGPGRRSPGRSPVQRSPTADSYGFPAGYQNDSFASSGQHRNSPGPYAGQYGQQRDDYHGNQRQNLSPVHGAGAGAGYGRRSPGQGYNQYNSPGPRRSPTQPQPNLYANEYGRQNYSPHDNRGVSPASYQNDTYAYNNARNPSPVNYQNDNYQNDTYAHQPARTHSPQYANTSPINTQQPQAAALPAALQAAAPPAAPAYPGQQTYHTEDAPMQPTYRAFTPAAQEPHRRGPDGSWKEI